MMIGPIFHSENKSGKGGIRFEAEFDHIRNK